MDQPSIPGYAIEAEIGTGGMGVVYRARHLALERTVALKVIHPRFTTDPAFLQSFANEAKIAAKLTHPNIVPVFDFGSHEGVYYFSMQYVLGQTVRDLLAARRPRLEELISIVTQVASALDYAHREEVLHRDVKTGNILLCPDGKAMVIDFGIAHGSYSTAANSLWLGAGTRAYMSPEQCKGYAATPRSDQYALAVAVYEMLAGRLPFGETDPVAVMKQHISEPPAPLTRGRTDITARMDSVVQRALAKIPEMRYSSVGEFARELEEACRQAMANEPLAPRATVPSAKSVHVAAAAGPVPLSEGAAAAVVAPRHTHRTGYLYATRGGGARRGPGALAWLLALLVLGAAGAAAYVFWYKPLDKSAPAKTVQAGASARSGPGSKNRKGGKTSRRSRQGAMGSAGSGASGSESRPGSQPIAVDRSVPETGGGDREKDDITGPEEPEEKAKPEDQPASEPENPRE